MKKLVLIICLYIPYLASGQEPTTDYTIHAQVSDGYWYTPATWAENRVPDETDSVYIDRPIKMRGTSATVRYLTITSNGSLRGRNQYYQGRITVTEHTNNQGSIGGYMSLVALGGEIHNTGLINADSVRVLPGHTIFTGTVTTTLALQGDIELAGDLHTDFPFRSQGNAITSTSSLMQLTHILDNLSVLGTSTIRVTGHNNESVLVAGITATSSTIFLSADQSRINGNILSDTLHIQAPAKLSKTGLTLGGDVIIDTTGQLFGEAVWVAHALHINGNLINQGTFGPYVAPIISGDIHTSGAYTSAQNMTLIGSQDRKIIGSIPVSVHLADDQNWVTSASIYDIHSNGHSIHLADGVRIQATNIYDSLTLMGTGDLVITDPLGNEGYSPNVQEIIAPESVVTLSASDARLGGNITARTIEIHEPTIASRDITMQADEVSFIQGSLSGRGSRNATVIIDSPTLTGSGGFGPFVNFYLNTNIPLGFTAGWNTGVFLEQPNTQWQGKYRLAGTVMDFLSDPLSVITNSQQPNLRDALNTGSPHYYSYLSSVGWIQPFVINGSTSIFDDTSSVIQQKFFDFSFIPNQDRAQSFRITITTPLDEQFTESIRLSSTYGDIYPYTVMLHDGIWQGEVTLFTYGSGQRIIATGVGNHSAFSGRSNYFSLSGADNMTGTVQGVVRSAVGAREHEGTVTLNSATDGTEYRTDIDSQGHYYLNIPCGLYYIQTVKSISDTVHVPCQEVVIHDIISDRLCPTSDIVPVLLIPGIMGSDSSHNPLTIFPELTHHIPQWDEGVLHIHDPFGSVGFTSLIDAFQQSGYIEGCTVFSVPYDWSIPVAEIAAQFLQPMIDHARTVAGSEYVDIVAHSMGGLVARSYIQGPDYNDDVRKVAMVGTPNAGSVQSYFAWEGGDPIQSDNYGGNWLDSFIEHISQADQFQTKTIAKNHLIKTRDQKPLCRREWFGRDYASCDHVRVRGFLHSSALSVGELFPVYDFLKDHKSEKSISPQYRNFTLLSLNQLDCGGSACVGDYVPYRDRNIETQLFIGIEENVSGYSKHTPEIIYVLPDEQIGYYYTDGAIQYVEQGIGDGTVIVDSVQVVRATSVSGDNQHSKLIKFFETEIIHFIKN